MQACWELLIDTLFYNGKGRIHWLASSRGWIQDLGTGKPPKHLLAKKKINLEGHEIFPGWIDSHVHLYLLGSKKYELDVGFCSSQDELLEILKGEVTPKTSGLEVCGWKGSELSLFLLDQVSSCIPIIVRRVDEHAVWVNTCLLKKANILKKYPTGFLADKAMKHLEPFRPKVSPHEIEAALMEAEIQLLSDGITSVHDMATELLPLKTLITLMQQKKMNLRVSCALYGKEACNAFPKPQVNLFNHHLNIRAKKIFIDGALGSRGAWLSSPYEDSPGHCGTPLSTEKELVSTIRKALQNQFQLIFHVLGDQASIFVLEILNTYFSPKEVRDRRFRFEHLEVCHPKVLPLMKKFGIIASVQPWHIVSDRPWLEKRLGKKRMNTVGIFDKMKKKGIPLCGGSDTPIEPHDPRLVKKFVHFYTVGGAYAEFSEDTKGTLEIGKLADFSVRSKEKTEMTVVGGEVVYAR
ncbi:MAG: hypothetical protein A2Z91_07430 [Deltaproteobacteria bacterium GWA2_38_16]|nr:MAG: hypothetical protein A2Z91_07430 [Deltaproteobacteria bacterium GWA2_38_16]OGQ02738.1 MAG: hypothetical protein A3D19_00765 [Deltaproteobacteria bacterium RIFCSPHIGHO2_02_FULL_38_15]OGQ31863.1 MAG: hypothetical protein A3A72_02300 [Deltaproteobacteria bacterium RIFCSPLOWO2_01_FULL_38_9]OGQ59078.1 MAG: hypothetical protein A3G92_06135 [Deltaproteobacteria bacterium RIFCSPLOWO2_12_FULL_38_8]